MNFAEQTAPNVAITFALATIPIVGAVGAAVDYSHANSVKVAMQAAADSTTLMLAKDAARFPVLKYRPGATPTSRRCSLRPEATGLNLNINYTTESGSQVTVAATADVKTDFMQMMGFPKLKVGANSQARWGNTKLRVGLVLDNTGSMASDGKMDALKTATKALLHSVEKLGRAERRRLCFYHPVQQGRQHRQAIHFKFEPAAA